MPIRIVLLFIAVALAGNKGVAQKHQFSIHLNSGFFSFGGASASATSFLNVSDVSSIPSYTNNPYGTKSGFSYGAGIQYQRLSRKEFIYGIQLGYESLSSRIDLDHAAGEFMWNVDDGKTILTNTFVNVFPSFGKRINAGEHVDIDFLLGCDFGFGLSSIEHYSATNDQGLDMSGDFDRDIPTLDFRPRLEMINYYRNFGVSIGYSLGLTNYQAGLDGADREAMSRYLRLGLSYRLHE